MYVFVPKLETISYQIWHNYNIPIKPKLAETELPFFGVTDVQIFPKRMNQNLKWE